VLGAELDPLRDDREPSGTAPANAPAARHRSLEVAGPDLGLRPESVARLRDSDRDLLARLQAELAATRPDRQGRNGQPGSASAS